MMKKQVLCNILVVTALAVFCCGCGSLLTYNGEDYDKERVKIVQTNESMVFSTYLKESDGVSLRAGVSKASVQGVLVLYAEFTNGSGEDLIFNVKDIKVTAQGQALPIISPSDYLNAFQGEQTGMLASMQSMAPALRSMATLSNSTYANEMRSVSSEHLAADSSTKDIAETVRGISLHTINSVTTLKSGTRNYFYLFYHDMDTYPIEVTYGDLSYSFMGKSTYNRFAEE